MKLKSFGCSFIFGTDLADDGRNLQWPTASNFTWPALLAKHYNQKYECYAKAGSGNLQILEKIINQISYSSSSDLFVIGWTWIDRFDYYLANYNPATKTSPWNTILPVDENELAKIYYRDLHSEYRDKLTSLMYIKLAIDILDQKGIRFIMTYVDELLFDRCTRNMPGINELQTYIRPRMTTFEGNTFLNWSKQKGFEISSQWHPLESAHRHAADLLIKAFDKQKTSDPDQQAHA